MQPSPYMQGSCGQVTKQGSHPDTRTLLGMEVPRSISITQFARRVDFHLIYSPLLIHSKVARQIIYSKILQEQLHFAMKLAALAAIFSESPLNKGATIMTCAWKSDAVC